MALVELTSEVAGRLDRLDCLLNSTSLLFFLLGYASKTMLLVTRK